MYFPVLRSGVAVQYPVSRTEEFWLAEAETPGGGVWRSLTGRSPLRRWRIELDEISDEEAAALASFYEECRGGWATFSFADPLGNLLVWSEDLSQPVWKKSPGITVNRAGGEAGAAEFLVVNGSGAAGLLWQDLDLAPGAAVCFSCEIQGSPGQEASLLAAGTMRRVSAEGAWKAEHVTGSSAGGLQRVGLEVPAGAGLRVRRLQTEMQIAPSEYQPTYETGGVFPRTRFAQDGLRIVSVAPGRNRARITLESVAESGS